LVRLSAGARSDFAQSALGIPLTAAGSILDRLKRISETDRARALEQLEADGQPASPQRELLDWQEVAEMARAGIDFEVHGATHAILPGLSRERVTSELSAAASALRERGLARHSLLAYPSGAHDSQVANVASACGYRAAFTTRRGLLSAECSHLTLPRVLLHEDVSSSAAEFFFRVPGWFS
jgi:peptidoglycan/xylan/chitin deacetylase (PgdA/CDA1 family)